MPPNKYIINDIDYSRVFNRELRFRPVSQVVIMTSTVPQLYEQGSRATGDKIIPFNNFTHFLKPQYMTLSSWLFYKGHILKTNIESEELPRVPRYYERFPIFFPYAKDLMYQHSGVEYDRTQLFHEKFTICI